MGKGDVVTLLNTALTQGIITQAEVELIHVAEKARLVAISVDDLMRMKCLGNDVMAGVKKLVFLGSPKD